jgi:hypothetical protein
MAAGQGRGAGGFLGRSRRRPPGREGLPYLVTLTIFSGNLGLTAKDHRTNNHSGNPAAAGLWRSSEHIGNFSTFLGSCGFGKKAVF